jgi:hypothetical protein
MEKDQNHMKNNPRKKTLRELIDENLKEEDKQENLIEIPEDESDTKTEYKPDHNCNEVIYGPPEVFGISESSDDDWF